jgi:transposase-like protein
MLNHKPYRSIVRTNKEARTMAVTDGRRQRRSYSAEFKAQLVQRCRSEAISAVALSHGINPVTVHRWIREDGQRRQALQASAQAGVFMAVSLPRPAAVPVTAAALTNTNPGNLLASAEHGKFELEVQLHGQLVRVSWPVSAAAAAAAWLKELLR